MGRLSGKVWFRVDGGNQHGLAMGHVYRCLKTARRMVELGLAEPVFIMRGYPEGVAKVRAEDFEVVEMPAGLSWEQDLEFFLDHIKGQKVFLDVRAYSPDVVARLRETSACLIVFEDLGGRDLRPHVLVNPAINPLHLDYPERSREVVYCLGPDYFILGRPGCGPRDTPADEVRKILVTLGGADPDGYTLALHEKIRGLLTDYQVTYVLGPAFGDAAGFQKKAGKEKGVRIIQSAPDLPCLMAGSDLVIAAGGDTCLELAWSGASGMLAPTIDYEMETARHLESMGVFPCLGDIKKRPGSDICGEIDSFARNVKQRRRASAKGKALIDGGGIDRILTAAGLA